MILGNIYIYDEVFHSILDILNDMSLNNWQKEVTIRATLPIEKGYLLEDFDNFVTLVRATQERARVWSDIKLTKDKYMSVEDKKALEKIMFDTDKLTREIKKVFEKETSISVPPSRAYYLGLAFREWVKRKNERIMRITRITEKKHLGKIWYYAKCDSDYDLDFHELVFLYTNEGGFTVGNLLRFRFNKTKGIYEEADTLHSLARRIKSEKRLEEERNPQKKLSNNNNDSKENNNINKDERINLLTKITIQQGQLIKELRDTEYALRKEIEALRKGKNN